MTLAFFEPRPALETVLSQEAGPHLTREGSRSRRSPQPRTGLTRKVLQMGLWRLSLLPGHLPRASGRSPCLPGTPHSQLLGEGGILAVPCPSIPSSPPRGAPGGSSPGPGLPTSPAPRTLLPTVPSTESALRLQGLSVPHASPPAGPRAWKSHQNRPSHLWGAATCASRWV